MNCGDVHVGRDFVAAKKPKMDERAKKLKAVKAEIKELEKQANGLRTELLNDLGPGSYEGFVIIAKKRSMLDQELLAAQLGDLEPYKKESSAMYIEFV